MGLIRSLLIGILLFSFFFCSRAHSQNNCPEGFVSAGTLSGSGAASEPFNKRQTLRLPEDATLDESFQQKKVHATNGKNGASSTMDAQDIPKGILILPYGTSDGVYKQGWAVSEPELKAIDRDSNGHVTRYQFGMKLFCSVSNSGANPQFGECSVGVDVCYKPLH